jgi:hypothetical protein
MCEAIGGWLARRPDDHRQGRKSDVGLLSEPPELPRLLRRYTLFRCWGESFMRYAFAIVAALFVPSAAHADLFIDVYDDGVLIGSASSTSDFAVFNGSDDGFTSISVTASGQPDDGPFSGGDLNTSVIASTDSPFDRTLTVDIVQTKVFYVNVESTFSADNTGPSGLATEATYYYPAGLDNIKVAFDSALFPAGTTSSTMGPYPNAVGPAQTLDGEGYVIDFKPGQSVNDTIEFAASPVVPESSTWVMVLTGFGAMGWLGRRGLRESKRLRLEPCASARGRFASTILTVLDGHSSGDRLQSRDDR